MVLFTSIASIPKAYSLVLTIGVASALGLELIVEATQATHLRAPTHDRRDRPDLTFPIWATVVLTGLAIVSVVLGVAPLEDPTMIMAAP
jgi:hypothetical protein